MSQKPNTYTINTSSPVSAPVSKPGGRNPVSRKALGLSAVVAALLVAAGATYAFWPREGALAKVIAQVGNDPQKIRKAVDDGKISREDAREAIGRTREVEMDQRMDGYFALGTQKERDKYLDSLIDEMQKRRKEWEQRAATQPARDRRPTTRSTSAPTTRPDRGDRGQRMANRMDTTPPDRRAKRAEFMAAMRQRMTARGIQMPGGGRGPGGWGGGGGRGGGGR